MSVNRLRMIRDSPLNAGKSRRTYTYDTIRGRLRTHQLHSDISDITMPRFMNLILPLLVVSGVDCLMMVFDADKAYGAWADAQVIAEE